MSSAMVHFFSSKTRYLTASRESTVVAKVTASRVVRLISAPPWVISRPVSAQPFTMQERYGVRKNFARADSDVSYTAGHFSMMYSVCFRLAFQNRFQEVNFAASP